MHFAVAPAGSLLLAAALGALLEEAELLAAGVAAGAGAAAGAAAAAGAGESAGVASALFAFDDFEAFCTPP